MDIVKELGISVLKEINYVRSLDENTEILRSKMAELCSRGQDIETDVNREEVQFGTKRKSEVELWLNNVIKIKNEVQDIEEKFSEERGILSQLKFGKLVAKKIKEVDELKKKGNFSDGFTAELSPESGKTLPVATPFIGKAAKETQKHIQDLLRSVSIGKIGVCGMGGSGKTTIMKHVHNHLKDNNARNVIWVTVSQAFNLKRLQSDIAKAIKLELAEEEYEKNRAKELHSALLRRGKFILILDDMWEAFPLEDIGIPEPNEDNGCKIVIITRSLQVCAGMETQKEVRVDLLSKDEAWELFKNKVGGHAMTSDEVRTIAKQVVNECGCLPLAIVTIGRTMSKVKDVRVWRDTLRELKESSTEINGIENIVYHRLKFSYNRLSSSKIQACFLYCALYPEDYEIPATELIEHWIYEGLIDDKGDKEVKFDKGHTIFYELMDACMLEKVVNESNAECVKMHDLIRDMAIDITRKNPHFMVKAGIGLTESPREEEWTEDLERASLMDNRIEVLGGRPNCSKLCTLLLQRNCGLMEISHSFFQYMHNLRVLNISNTKIESLPESVSDLGNLRALILGSCRGLKKLPSLVKLKELRVLKLHSSGIIELPQGMEMLIKLRHLDLNATRNLKMFPVGMIPKLLHLEDLLMESTGCRWEEMEGGIRNEDLICSKKLANLSLSFSNLDAFSNYVRSGHWQVLKSFDFHVGESEYRGRRDHCASVGIRSCNIPDRGLSLVLPCTTQNLNIENCNGDVGLCLSDLKELKRCSIYKCHGEMMSLLKGGNTLPNLEWLGLDSLFGLRTLCSGFMPHDTFSSLKVLSVIQCDSMVNLFSIKVLEHLQNLEALEIWNCCSLMELVVREEEIDDGNGNSHTVITLPKLNHLRLCSLHKLQRMFESKLVCESLCFIDINRCYQLKQLPFMVNTSLNLEMLEIPSTSCSGLMPRDTFSSLKVLNVEYCWSLVNLFSVKMLKRLQNLETMTVAFCGSLIELVGKEEEINEEPHDGNSNSCSIALPKLKTLKLIRLPKLKSICESKLVCESLLHIQILECPQLKQLPFSVDNPPPLQQHFEGQQEWWDALESDDLKRLLQPKFVLTSINF